MTKAILVRVTTDIEVLGERATAFWVVATSDPVRAVQIVRERVPPGCVVEATDTPVREEYLERAKLAPEQACHF